MIKKLALLVSVLVLLGSARGAEEIVFRQAQVFDGEKALGISDVLVADGKIVKIGKNIKTDGKAREIQATGKTLLPGLIDAHVHAYGDALEKAIQFGVTTQIDMFTSVDFLKQAKERQARGENYTMSDLFSAGTLATAPRGHGTEYGIKIPVIASPEEADGFVKDRIAEGSDFIKIIYDDGTAYGLSMPALSRQTMAALVTAAHQYGKLAVVHIATLQAALDAANAGADGLAHIFIDRLPDKKETALLASRLKFVIPTLTVNGVITGYPDPPALEKTKAFENLLSPSDRVAFRKTFPMKSAFDPQIPLKAAGLLYRAGLTVLAGTDAPNPGTVYGASLQAELEYLVRAGLSLKDALRAATSLPARCFGLTDRGRIAAGMKADLLLVTGNPLEDILRLRDIAAIIKDGRELDRKPYLEKTAKAQEERRAALSAAPPKGLGDGSISDFEDGTAAPRFGAGIVPSTDSYAGGKSQADVKVVEGGAGSSKYSLLVSGEVREGFTYAWAGMIFFTGDRPFAPANLSSKREISFWAKSDGSTYSISLFTKTNGFMPIARKFTSSAEWKHYSFRISDFDGTEGADITGISITAGPEPGKFEIWLDDLRLE